jgi:rare lipoprotein A
MAGTCASGRKPSSARSIPVHVVTKKQQRSQKIVRRTANNSAPRFRPHRRSEFAAVEGRIVSTSRNRGNLYLRVSTRTINRSLAAALTAAALAGCAQVPTSKSELTATREHTALLPIRKRTDAVLISRRRPQGASVGLASYYSEGSRTASGEKLDPNELTAAHPTLPFGTRLLVTSLKTGRSVVVRVNDRGPFVKGRVVDLSYSAAVKLGLTERGVAKVKLDVVH